MSVRADTTLLIDTPLFDPASRHVDDVTTFVAVTDCFRVDGELFDLSVFIPPMPLHEAPAYSNRSVCLPRCALWLNGTFGVYRCRIGVCGRYLDWYRFRPPRSTLTPQMGVELGGRVRGRNLTLEFRPNSGR